MFHGLNLGLSRGGIDPVLVARGPLVSPIALTTALGDVQRMSLSTVGSAQWFWGLGMKALRVFPMAAALDTVLADAPMI